MPILPKHLHLASQPKFLLIVPIEHEICWQLCSTQIMYFYPNNFCSHLIMQYMCQINLVKWKATFLSKKKGKKIRFSELIVNSQILQLTS